MSLTLIRGLVLSLALSAASLAAAAAPDAGDDIGAGALEAVQAVDAFSAAIKAAKIDEAAGWLAPDLLVLESGGAERSREQYLAEHAGADAVFLAGATVERGHRRARAQGELAWVATESTLTRGDKAYLSTETMVLQHGADGWKIVHIHWSSRPR